MGRLCGESRTRERDQPLLMSASRSSCPPTPATSLSARQQPGRVAFAREPTGISTSVADDLVELPRPVWSQRSVLAGSRLAAQPSPPFIPRPGRPRGLLDRGAANEMVAAKVPQLLHWNRSVVRTRAITGQRLLDAKIVSRQDGISGVRARRAAEFLAAIASARAREVRRRLVVGRYWLG
jgi:hypothetical protein